MKIIAIINLKGGVAKTTTAVSMAELLAIKSKVLLFDNDKQGNASGLFEVYNRKSESEACKVLKTASVKGNIRQTKNKRMDIIPCNYYMELTELQIKEDREHPQHNRYKEALAEISNEYDYCIIDNAPDLGINVINALVAADDIIIPVNLDCYTLDGLEELVDQVKNIQELNKNASVSGCLITDFEKTDTSEAAEKWLREKFNLPIFEQKIRHSKKVKDSTFYKQTPLGYSPRSGAAQDYKKFVKEYTERERIYGI